MNNKRDLDKEAFWQLAIEQHRDSGLNVRAFCKQEGLSEPGFYFWRRELKARKALSKKVPPKKAAVKNDFMPLAVTHHPALVRLSVGKLHIQLPAGEADALRVAIAACLEDQA